MDTENQAQMPTPPADNVGFPTQGPQKKKKSFPVILAIIPVFLLILGGLGYFIFKGAGSEGDSNASPSPRVEGLSTAATQAPSPTPIPSPSATPADKKSIKITVLNGTGVPGEAAYLQNFLKNLGYTQVDTGNAETDGATSTQIVYSDTLAQGNIDELTTKLKDIYKSVTSKSDKTLSTNEVKITTGPRKTTTASATATPKATTASSASPSASPKVPTTPDQ